MLIVKALMSPVCSLNDNAVNAIGTLQDGDDLPLESGRSGDELVVNDVRILQIPRQLRLLKIEKTKMKNDVKKR